MKKITDLISETKLYELLKNTPDEVITEPEAPKKSKNTLVIVFAIIGVVAAVIGAAYAVYRYFKPDYLEDYEEDFDDDDVVIDSIEDEE